VRDNAYVKQSADLLAEVTLRMKKLVQHMKEKYSQRTDVQRLIENFNPSRIVETLPTSLHTAYSQDKGKKIAFCLQKQKEDMKRIDINTLTFVAIHELSHLMTESIGHEQAFWKNFKFLLKNAVAIGIYDSIDYQQQPEPYCGMTIDDNPLYA
jgi:predicted metal-dependent hydrolase